MLSTVWGQIKSWIAAPYTQEMDATQVFLLTGLVIVCVIIWSFLISKID